MSAYQIYANQTSKRTRPKAKCQATAPNKESKRREVREGTNKSAKQTLREDKKINQASESNPSQDVN